jgi:hypothetical protein
VCTVWKLISSRYESLASFESVPLIPVRYAVDQNNLSEGEVIEYLVLKGNYMLSKHEDYEPLLTRYCNSSDLSLSLHFSLISLATFSILTEEDTS